VDPEEEIPATASRGLDGSETPTTGRGLSGQEAPSESITLFDRETQKHHTFDLQNPEHRAYVDKVRMNMIPHNYRELTSAELRARTTSTGQAVVEGLRVAGDAAFGVPVSDPDHWEGKLQEAAQRMQEREARNPAAALAGNVAGLLMTGVTSGATKVGAAASRVVAKRMAGQALKGKITSQAAAAAARRQAAAAVAAGAAEGAVVGAAEEGFSGVVRGVRDSMAAKGEIVPESVLMSGLQSAALGATVGGALGGGIARASKGVRQQKSFAKMLDELTISKSGAVSKEARVTLQDTVQAATGARIPKSVADEAIRKSKPSFFESLTDVSKSARRRLGPRGEEIVDELRGDLGRVRRAGDLDSKAGRQARAAELADDFKAINRAKIALHRGMKIKPAVLRKMVQEATPEGVEQVARATADAEQLITQIAERAPALGIEDNVIRQLRSNVQRVQDAPLDNPSEFFTRLDDFKRATQDLATRAHPEFEDSLKGLSEQLRKTLENSQVVGSEVAELQARANAAFREFYDADSLVRKLNTKGLEVSSVDKFQTVPELDIAKADTLINSLGMEGGQQKLAGIEEFFTKFDNLAEELDGLYDGPEFAKLFKEGRAASKNLRGKLAGLNDDAAARRMMAELKDLERASGGAKNLRDAVPGRLADTAVIGGAAFGGPLGAAVGFGLKQADEFLELAASPSAVLRSAADDSVDQGFFRAGMIRYLMAERRAADASATAIRKALGKDPQPVTSLGRMVAESKETRALGIFLAGRSLEEAFTEESTQVLNGTADERIADLVPGMDEEPEIALGLVGKLEQQHGFLQEKHPLPPGIEPTEKVLSNISSRDQRRWLRYAAAAQNPVAAVMEIGDGGLAPESKEVLQTLFPEIYRRTQDIALQELQDPDVSFSRRRQVGTMLDLPVVPGASPAIAGVVSQLTSPQAAEEQQALAREQAVAFGQRKIDADRTADQTPFQQFLEDR